MGHPRVHNQEALFKAAVSELQELVDEFCSLDFSDADTEHYFSNVRRLMHVVETYSPSLLVNMDGPKLATVLPMEGKQ